MGLPVVMREAGPFTATGGETLLPFGFAISRADDIAVYRTRGTVTGTLTLITDYAVDGVGLANGGNVVLVLPAVPGDVYKIVGYASLERDGAVVAGAGFIAGLNRDLDRLTRVDQEIRRDLKLAMVLNPLDSGDAALPPRVPNKLLGVDEAGRWAMRDAGGGAPGGVDAAAVQGIVTDVLDTEFAAYARNYVIADPAERRAGATT